MTQQAPTVTWDNRIVGHGTRKASEFTPHPNNWRKHPRRQKSAMRGSLDTLGWINDVIVNIRTGRVIDGHERIEEALANGDAPVPYKEVDLSEAEEAQALLQLDAIAAMATTDRENMEVLLHQVQTDNADVMKHLTDLARDKGIDFGDPIAEDDEPDIDRARELQKKWKTKLGQTWRIGSHIVTCGDATDRKTYERLMGKERAACVNTDPPYGVNYQSRATGEAIKGDDLKHNELLTKLLIPAFKNLARFTADSAAFYIYHASDTRRDFEWALDAAAIEEKQYLIWVKEAFVLGHSDYRWQHEPIFYCQKAGQSAAFYGDRKQPTCWRITPRSADELAVNVGNGVMISNGVGAGLFIQSHPPRNKKIRHVRAKAEQPILIMNEVNTTTWEVRRDSAAEYLHPTQKPPELAERAIENSTLPGEIVLDCFLGAGGTLIAAERLGRQCRGIELDPKYVAVVLERAERAFDGIHIEKLV